MKTITKIAIKVYGNFHKGHKIYQSGEFPLNLENLTLANIRDLWFKPYQSR